MSKHINLCRDIKSEGGKWVRSYVEDSKQYHTKAGLLYERLTQRCLTGGAYSKKFSTYLDCENHFEDFQSFTEWCQSQPGYFLHNGGKPWCLDKDILVPGNKIYSPETCCFVPEFINVLFVNKINTTKHNLPLGVSPHLKKYRARCSTMKGRLHLGMFETPHAAHQAWQKAKICHILDSAEKYLELEGSQEFVHSAILRRADAIRIDFENNKETKFV